MNTRQKKYLILNFIDGPLKEYLTGDISFSRFKELINERFGTDFVYSDLYPSYLFNARLSYETENKEEFLKNLEAKPVPKELYNKLTELVGDIEIDLEQKLNKEDE